MPFLIIAGELIFYGIFRLNNNSLKSKSDTEFESLVQHIEWPDITTGGVRYIGPRNEISKKIVI